VDELVSRDERNSGQGQGRRSWVVRGLMALVVVGTAGVLGPRLLANPSTDADTHRPPPSSSPTTVRSTTPPPTLPAESLLRWKVRGDLARDAAFLSAAAVRAKQVKATPDLVPLYAATLPDGGRVALLATRPGEVPADEFAGAPLLSVHVPAGAPVEKGSVSYSGGIGGPDDIAGWAGHGSDGRLFAVILGRPAPFDVQFSTRIQYHPDGTGTRQWRSVSGRNGSAIVELRGRTDPVVVIRARVADEVSDPMPVMLSIDGDRTEDDVRNVTRGLHVEGLGGPGYNGPEPAAVRNVLAEGSYGLLDATAAEVRVLWSGRLRGDRKLVLLRLRRPDGASFQTALFQNSNGETFTMNFRSVPWADADVVPWLLTSGDPDLPLLLVVPSGRGEIVVRPSTDDGETRYRVGADGLVNLGEDQAVAADRVFGATVTVLDRLGHRVVRAKLANPDDDPFVLGQ
jgi:hypothetical protein